MSYPLQEYKPFEMAEYRLFSLDMWFEGVIRQMELDLLSSGDKEIPVIITFYPTYGWFVSAHGDDALVFAT